MHLASERDSADLPSSEEDILQSGGRGQNVGMKRQRSEEVSPKSSRLGEIDFQLSSSPRKRRKSAANEDRIERTKHSEKVKRPLTGLLDLPVELLQTIHVYAKNPDFPLTNKRIHSIFSASPVQLKARYLLARWHEAYCYGFQQRNQSNTPSRKRKPTEISYRPPLPNTSSTDLLSNGSLPELAWTGRFIPVLPTTDFPYPMSNAFHRSADHFILDYCLRYRICNVTVLHAVEDVILRRPEFGNILIATGLWRDVEGYLHAHEPRYGPAKAIATTSNDRYAAYNTSLASRYDDEGETMDVHNAKPAHLRITEVPKRLFQSLKTGIASGQRGECDKDSPPPSSLSDYTQNLDKSLSRYLRAFDANGKGPFPSHSSLILLLSIAAMHVPTTAALPAASAPFNSFEGLPLAKATFAKSTFMVQLLLALGAEPSRKGSLSLYIAIRSGWLEGLIQLVERDEAKFIEWQAAMDGIRDWFRKHEKDPNQRWNTDRFYTVENTRQETNEELDKDKEAQFDPPSSSSSSSITSAMNGLPHRLPKPVSMLNSDGSGSNHSSSSNSVPGLSSASQSSFKRRRLLDRANLDSKMLKEAVKHNNWPIANWLRSKGIVPDLRTIKLIEMKQNDSHQHHHISRNLQDKQNQRP